MNLTLVLLFSIVAGIVSTALLFITHNFWVKKGWSETIRPAVLGLVLIVSMLLIMIPAHMIMDKVIEIQSTKVITPLDLPDMESEPYHHWVGEFGDKDEHCLALNIYFEARGEEDIRGKYAVADVVMYRYMHADFPDTVCGVVEDGHYYEWRPDLPVKHMCQFSWFCDGKSDRPVNFDAFEEAIGIAKEVLYDPSYKPRVGYSLFYHAVNVSPKWSKRMIFVETIGNHSFYTKRTGHSVP